MKRLTLLMAAMLLMLAGCKNPELETVDVDSVSVSPTSLDLKVGESATLTATVKPDNASDKTVSWQSTAPAVAKVENGVVTALSEGTAYIHATAGGETGVCTVTVSAAAVPVESITLDFSEKELTEGESFTLTATVLPSDATDKTVSWYAMNAGSGILSVSGDGTVTALAPGHETVIASCGDARAYCEVTVVKAGPKMVDLGLSVLWADRNIGADAPEAYGDYYAWGETETKEAYSFNNCKWFNGGTENLTKYITHEKNGVVDNNMHMDPEDDVAYTLLGDKWRIPTEAEFKELLDRCTWEWKGDAENKGGYKVTGPNGNSIYLPSAGGKGLTEAGYTGFYWAADILVSVPNNCSQLLTDPGSAVMSTLVRFFGCSVRPVYGDIVRVGGVSLDSDSETLNQGETLQLSANIAPQNAFEKGILWTSSDESVATVGNNYDNYGLVTAVGEGTATITATTVDGGFKATCTVTVIKSFEFAAVDLGLSVKWANANLGASTPEDAGNYFAWGGTTTQDSYTWSTCPFVVSGTDWDSVKYSKYDGSPTTLEPMDDAASVNLGGKWRMPTEEEFNELISSDNSTIESITVNGINGVQITSKKTGSSIFLPAVGTYERTDTPVFFNDSGFYWSSCLVNGYHSSFAKCFNFVGNLWEVTDRGRCEGMPIRAVWAE